jgi:hypothetical protein
MRSTFWNGKPWQAFKTFAILFSFTVNIILLIVLLLVAPLIIPIVDTIAKPIVGGLNSSFIDMSNASIVRTISVEDTMPISFTLPLEDRTNVVLAEAVPLNIPARFVLPGGGGAINGNVALNLPQGLVLPVELKLAVPVNQEIPVALDVAVEIPLQETELGRPFNTLRALFEPLNNLLIKLPSSNDELIDRVRSSAGPRAASVTPVEQ